MFGSPHAGEPGPWDATRTCLVACLPLLARLLSCKSSSRAWLRNNARFGRSSSAWLARCSGERARVPIRARRDGAKLLGLPPPFPPFTVYISSFPPPLFLFLSLPICAAGSCSIYSSSCPLSFLLDSCQINTSPVSRFVVGEVDLKVLHSSEFSPNFSRFFSPIWKP